METGQKFYSKEDVIHYVEMGNLCYGTPQQISKHNKTSSENKPMPVAAKTDETPEWLPHGWITEVKTHNSGLQIGKTYKCYIDPLSGRKFYSKPQVFEYLKTVEHNNWASQQKTGIDSVSNVCSQHPQVKFFDLVLMWFLTMPDMGEVTGGKTSLKIEGSQNPETSEGMSFESKQKQTGFRKQSVKKVVIERVIPDGLPPGWIKETRIEKKGKGTRRDPYYTDPVSGYVFRSQKDALRYLETGDINSCASKPKKRIEMEFLNEETSLPRAANMQQEHHTTRRCLFEGLENSATSSLETEDAEGLQKRQCTSVSADAVITSTSTAMHPVGKNPLDNGTEECAEMKENNDPSSSPLPRTESSNKRKLGERVCVENESPSSPSSEMVLEEKLAENVMGNSNNRKMQIDSSISKKEIALSLPRRSSNRLAGIKPEMVVNMMVGERVFRAEARKIGENKAKPSLETLGNVAHSAPQPFESVSETEISYHAFTGTEAPPDVDHPNRSKPLENQAVPEDQPVGQETEKKHEHLESQFLYSFGDPWSDPCLEFAFKTLTGAIPIEDNLAIQGIENSLSSSFKTTDAEGLQKRQCMTISADAMVTLTPTAEIMEGKHPLGNGTKDCAETKESSDPSSSPLPRTEGSNTKQIERVCDDNGTVSTPSPEFVREEKLAENGMVKITSRKVQIDSSKFGKKKEGSFPCRSSKRLAGLKPEMAVNFALSEQVLRAAARKSGQNETKPSPGPLDNVAHIAPQLFETVSETDIARHTLAGTEAPSNLERNKKPLEDQSLPKDQPVRQETEKKDENLESQLLYPFEDSWSDPCLEFAFKTLTGAIPIEDNFVIQGYFQQQVGTSHVQDGCSALPEFGLPNIFQNDFSSDFDATGKSVSAPQFPENPTFLPPGNLSLPTCSGNAPQEPSLEGNKEQQTKVNS